MTYMQQPQLAFKNYQNLPLVTAFPFAYFLKRTERLIRYIIEIKVRLGNIIYIPLNRFYITRNKQFIPFFHPILKKFFKKYHLSDIIPIHSESNYVSYSDHYHLNFRSEQKPISTLRSRAPNILASARFYTKTCSEIEHGNEFGKKFVY